MKKLMKRFLFASVVLNCACLMYLHRRVIRALLTGGEMPEMPENHPHVFCHKKKA